MPDEIQRLDGRIDAVVREHTETRERTVRLETEQRSHAAQLGKVNDLEKGMVKLNTSFSEFRSGTREDLAALTDGQKHVIASLDALAAARIQDKQDEAKRREEERDAVDTAKESRSREMWSRYIGVIGLLVLLLATLGAAFITTHGGF